MNQQREDRKNIVYFVRTDSLQREARIARLFGALTERGKKTEVFGVVKSRDGFSFPHCEYVCRADRFRWRPVKVVLKLFEIQLVALKAFWARYRKCDLLIVANHEFLFVGLLVRLLTRTPVVVDLHEHYYTWLLGIERISQFLFLRMFSGIIFANRIRAIDFLSERASSNNVVIIRNFPTIQRGSVATPQYYPTDRYRLGIVGGDVPGRFIRESVQALDQPNFENRIELVTFGHPLGFDTTHVTIEEHGTYRHSEILELLKSVDGSMIFYDSLKSANNRLCEPNRFFEAYNSGLAIFCFDHPSLSQFYDDYCHIIDQQRFQIELQQAVTGATRNKVESQRNRRSANKIDRQLLVFEEGIENFEFLLEFNKK